MKISALALSIFLVCCTTQDVQPPADIIPEKIFINILKNIHLSEADFELNKNRDLKSAKDVLASNYKSIYSDNNTSSANFKKSLDYYLQQTDRIIEIYDLAIKELKEDQSNLDQK